MRKLIVLLVMNPMVTVLTYVDDNKLLFQLPHTQFFIHSDLSYIVNCLEKWAKLVHFSGGEISWPKSWFQLLSWSVTNSKEKVQTAEESNISIIVNSVKDPENKIKLRHEDPQKGIRYLGVRQSLTGNNKQEFVIRLKEA